MEGIEKVCQFLEEAQTYYLATVDGDQPRVRPFGTILIFDGKLYIQTGKVKDVSRQLAANPKAEICAFKDGRWLRVAGELINDDNYDAKVAMLEKMPQLRRCTAQMTTTCRCCISKMQRRPSAPLRKHRRRSLFKLGCTANRID